MDWIADHIQIVIAIAAALAVWLKQALKQSGAARDDDADEAGGAGYSGRNADDSRDEDRARRIREEIRRKIAERAGGAPVRIPEPAPAPPPLFRSESGAPRPTAAPFSRREEPESDRAMAAVMERQQRLREQMEELERTRQRERLAAPATAAVSPLNPVAKNDGAAPRAPSWLREDLRNKDGLRRAIVLREVLGPPVGLR